MQLLHQGDNRLDAKAQRPGTTIPFSINIIQKVFLNYVKAEIDAKEEPEQDEKDGAEKPSSLLSKYLVENTDIFYVT